MKAWTSRNIDGCMIRDAFIFRAMRLHSATVVYSSDFVLISTRLLLVLVVMFELPSASYYWSQFLYSLSEAQ
jgi:hypothetical protein